MLTAVNRLKCYNSRDFLHQRFARRGVFCWELDSGAEFGVHTLCFVEVSGRLCLVAVNGLRAQLWIQSPDRGLGFAKQNGVTFLPMRYSGCRRAVPALGSRSGVVILPTLSVLRVLRASTPNELNKDEASPVGGDSSASDSIEFGLSCTYAQPGVHNEYYEHHEVSAMDVHPCGYVRCCGACSHNSTDTVYSCGCHRLCAIVRRGEIVFTDEAGNRCFKASVKSPIIGAAVQLSIVGVCFASRRDPYQFWVAMSNREEHRVSLRRYDARKLRGFSEFLPAACVQWLQHTHGTLRIRRATLGAATSSCSTTGATCPTSAGSGSDCGTTTSPPPHCETHGAGAGAGADAGAGAGAGAGASAGAGARARALDSDANDGTAGDSVSDVANRVWGRGDARFRPARSTPHNRPTKRRRFGFATTYRRRSPRAKADHDPMDRKVQMEYVTWFDRVPGTDNVLVTCGDGVLRLLSFSGKLLQSFRAPRVSITAAPCISRNGRYIYCPSQLGTVYVWKIGDPVVECDDDGSHRVPMEKEGTSRSTSNHCFTIGGHDGIQVTAVALSDDDTVRVVCAGFGNRRIQLTPQSHADVGHC